MNLSSKLIPKNSEATANRYVIQCMHITMIVVLAIWLLNALKIFIVNEKIMSYCVVFCTTAYLIGNICWLIFGINHKSIKYFILLWVVSIISVLGVGLTYHALIASVLPILFCSLYSSKKLFVYTTLLTIISTIIVVFAGYNVGICDANMTLLTTDPLTEYIDENNQFNLSDINSNPLLYLTIFFVIPRCLIYTVCFFVSYNITKIIRSNIEQAKRMKNLAETDSMTGFYNRSKYLDTVANSHKEHDNISVIFWDVNNLKTINDTKGHEAGDLLIRTIADSIHTIIEDTDRVFRIGGDEFIMIINNAGEQEVLNKIDLWQNHIKEIQPLYSFEISASVGYAYGRGADLKELINKADQMMYDDKRKYHTSR